MTTRPPIIGALVVGLLMGSAALLPAPPGTSDRSTGPLTPHASVRTAVRDSAFSTIPTWQDMNQPNNPRAGYAASLAYDSADNATVLFGGCAPAGYYGLFCGPTNGTYELDGGFWTPVSPAVEPPARFEAAMAYDSSDGYVVLFGGQGATAYSLNDTWSFSHGVWTNRTLAVAPPLDSGNGVLTADPSNGLLYYGGDCNSTWTYAAGTWSPVNTTGQTCPAGSDPVMAYDPLTNEVVYFGATAAGVPIGTWTFSGGRWANISGSLALQPPARTFASMAYDPQLGGLILYGGASAEIFPTYYTDTWEFSGAGWSNLSASAGVAGAPTYGAMAFVPGEQAIVEYGGHGLNGNGGSTWALGTPPLQAGWSYPGDALTVDEGATANLTVQITGGVGPFSVTWASPGLLCSSAGSATEFCGGSHPVSSNVTAEVSDAAGQVVVTAPLAVTIGAALLVLVNHPSTVQSGDTFTLNATASGGGPPYQFAYSGLPPGCSAPDRANVSCQSTPDGTYSITLTVTDQDHGDTQSTFTVVVQSPGELLGVPYLAYGLLAGIAAVAIGTYVVLRRRRRGPPPDDSVPEETETTDPGESAGTAGPEMTDAEVPPPESAEPALGPE